MHFLINDGKVSCHEDYDFFVDSFSFFVNVYSLNNN